MQQLQTLNHRGGNEPECFRCGAASLAGRCEGCGVTLRVRDFAVERLLSETPHSRVYLARDASGRKVALKELIYSLVPSAEQLDAYAREVEFLGQLSHPQIPKLLAAFSDGTGINTRMYLAQEFVEGEVLSTRLQRGELSEEEGLAVARQVLTMLGYLHSRTPKVLHRDIKPANLVRNRDGQIHLLDFGVARGLEGTRTHDATLVGTYGYMAPEQLGGTVDVRTDLYAVGATLVHLMTGRAPEVLLDRNLRLNFDPRKSLEPATRSFLQRLTAFRPEERFPSAEAALAALDAPTRAPWWKRRGSAILGIAAVAALVGHSLSDTLAEAPAVAPPVSTRPSAERAPSEPMMGTWPGQPQTSERASTSPTDRYIHPFHFAGDHAEWNFGNIAREVPDTSGKGHNLTVPAKGVELGSSEMGLDGTGGPLTAPDNQDFARGQTSAFNIRLSGSVAAYPTGGRAVLISRVDASGNEAYSLALEPGERLRFSLRDRLGRSNSVEGVVPPDDGRLDIMASFDLRSREMELFANGQVLAHAKTDLGPQPSSAEMRGGRLTVADDLAHTAGFQGVLRTLSLGDGFWEHTQGGSSLRGSPSSVEHEAEQESDEK